MGKVTGRPNGRPKKKHGGGRPTLMTPDTVHKLEIAYSMDCTDPEACLIANISEATLYNYQEKNPEFVQRKRLLKETLIYKSRTNVQTAIEDGDTEVSKWYLERKKKIEFATRYEQTGADGEKLELGVVMMPPKIDDNNE